MEDNHRRDIFVALMDKRVEEYRRTRAATSSCPASVENVEILPELVPKTEALELPVNTGYGYWPKKDTGAYMILTSLYYSMQKPDYAGSMTRNAILNAAQKRRRRSANGNNSTNHSSGWSAITTLMQKNYVGKNDEGHYWLTDSGVLLAIALLKEQSAIS